MPKSGNKKGRYSGMFLYMKNKAGFTIKLRYSKMPPNIMEMVKQREKRHKKLEKKVLKKELKKIKAQTKAASAQENFMKKKTELLIRIIAMRGFMTEEEKREIGITDSEILEAGRVMSKIAAALSKNAAGSNFYA